MLRSIRVGRVNLRSNNEDGECSFARDIMISHNSTAFHKDSGLWSKIHRAKSFGIMEPNTIVVIRKYSRCIFRTQQFSFKQRFRLHIKTITNYSLQFMVIDKVVNVAVGCLFHLVEVYDTH